MHNKNQTTVKQHITTPRSNTQQSNQMIQKQANTKPINKPALASNTFKQQSKSSKTLSKFISKVTNKTQQTLKQNQTSLLKHKAE